MLHKSRDKMLVKLTFNLPIKNTHKNSLKYQVQIKYKIIKKAVLHKLLVILNNKKTF